MAEFSPTLDVAKQTDVGLKRKRNEDFCQFLIPASGGPQEKYGALFVVADGMGAMGGGDVASQSAVEEIIRNYYAPTADDHPLPRLKGALEAANVFVRDQAQKIGLSRIGATAAGMILIPGGEVVLFNVGDSRVYRVRRRYIELLTHDQSVLQTQRDEGAVSDEDARLSRNVNVTSFIGQPTPVTPIYRRAKAQLGDIFVICTDGLWDLVEPYEILDIVQHAPAQAAVHKLVALARRRGAPDNVTVIAVRIGTSPRGKKGWLWFAAAALIIGGGGGLLALTQLNKGGKTVTETVVAVASSPTASNTPGVKWTETPTPIPTLTSPPISIIEPTSTESPTPSDTPLPTNSPTQSPTPTLTRTPTATPTRTPTLTLTNTLPPTATPSPVPSATPTATLTQTFTLVPSPTVTPSPSATTKHEPTVTLNPTLITNTPAGRATPVPTLSPAQQMLVFAAEEGVILPATTTLYVLPEDASATPQVLSETVLEPETQVMAIGTEERANPNAPDEVLRQVKVLSGPNRDRTGWLLQTALEGAMPITPHVIVKGDVPIGANIRRGDSTAHGVVGVMSPGESAKIVGISSRGTGWYLIELSDGTRGWIAPNLVITVGNVSDLPQVAPPPLPSPTPTIPASETPVEPTP